jgi:dienelactone hydrolase
MHTELVEHTDDGVTFEAHVAHPAGAAVRRPCILVAHAWDGQNEIIRTKAEELAVLGYVGFALDVYGKGVRGDVAGDNSQLMAPLMQDRGLLRRRLLAGLEAARAQPAVDPTRIAVLGYCFGGLCALDLARASPEGLVAAICIHGPLSAPSATAPASIRAKVLILHGWEDPTAPPADVLAVARELTSAGADWQLHAYGHAMHAFTYQGAAAPERGLLYDEHAARRARETTAQFLAEVIPATGSSISSTTPSSASSREH